MTELEELKQENLRLRDLLENHTKRNKELVEEVKSLSMTIVDLRDDLSRFQPDSQYETQLRDEFAKIAMRIMWEAYYAGNTKSETPVDLVRSCYNMADIALERRK